MKDLQIQIFAQIRRRNMLMLGLCSGTIPRQATTLRYVYPVHLGYKVALVFSIRIFLGLAVLNKLFKFDYERNLTETEKLPIGCKH